MTLNRISIQLLLPLGLLLVTCSWQAEMPRAKSATVHQASVPSSAPAAQLVATDPNRVMWVGNQATSGLGGDLSSHVALPSLASYSHLYALGPVEQLQGEVTIIDSRRYIASVYNGKPRISTGWDRGACYLAYADVSAWRTTDLPRGAETIDAIESSIPALARLFGIDSARPLVLLVRGEAVELQYRISHQSSGLEHGADAEESAAERFTLHEQPVTVVGFYSAAHDGAFLAADRKSHWHFVSSDGRHSGHVQSARFSGSATISLPATSTG